MDGLYLASGLIIALVIGLVIALIVLKTKASRAKSRRQWG
jgi:hypothetical protein